MQETQIQSLGWEDALGKEMATHSNILAWRIPGMGEPGGLPSVGLHRVGHNWRDLAAAAAAGFNSIWTENFHIFMLNLEKAEEPEIKSNIHWIIEKAKEF